MVLQKDKKPSLKQRIYKIIFETDTPAGKFFDILLIISILLSVLVVMLDSVERFNQKYSGVLYTLEWVFTVLFTFEYLLRVLTIGRPTRYIFSFFGLVDLMSFLPTYLDLLFPGTHYLVVFRAFRVLRVFRVLKLVKYVGEAELLIRALRASSRKVTVFLFSVLVLVTILGSIMYLIESQESGFTSIPRSIYWAIVTLTTVGYGDISPKTDLGQFMAAIIMIMGYAILAVPTGIVSVEFSNVYRKMAAENVVCHECSAEGLDIDSLYCKYCSAKIFFDGDG